MPESRRVSLATAAQIDLDTIAAWSAEKFGPSQAAPYIEAILDTIAELAAAKSPSRSMRRDEVAKGMMTLHMRKRGRPGRHLILYSETADEVKIHRLLHDSMELSRHAPHDDV